MTETVPRRRFLLGAAAGTVAGTAVALNGPSIPVSAAAAEPAPSVNIDPATEAMQILTATEAAFFAAAADCMIPADDLSPSGSECGVVVYIDRQLAGAFGAGARFYKAGPFQPNLPANRGYQLPLTPLEFFRAAVGEANQWCKKTYGKSFDRLSEADRTAALKAMESGAASFDGLASKSVFVALLQIVMEGFFADPIYGGNRDKASWRMIGYPGLPATYQDKIESYRGKRYDVPPQSIADFS